jgi:methyltransferase (TIGR00027 family)
MDKSENTEKEFKEINKNFMDRTGSGSKTAEGMAVHRYLESQKPDGERICYDPYAVYFISPAMMKSLKDNAKNPEETKKKAEMYERFFSGLFNSIHARVRYFDDFVKRSIDEELEQLVILGAGYDTRAYRIEGLKERIKVFEIDHPVTQGMKIEKVKQIFGSLPDHVTYVPVDFELDDLGERLMENGYDRALKTLFLMEGLIMYIPPEAVDKILSFISKNSGRDSAILFDYYLKSVVDGTSQLEVGRNIHNHLKQVGEPLKFGIEEGMTEEFLQERGFSQVCNVNGEDYKKMYFQGVNKDRSVCSLILFAHAVVR